MPRFSLAVALLLALPLVASALATEHFGKTPFNPAQWNMLDDVGKLANHPGRFYWYEVNGSPAFFYRGDVAAVNEAMALFAKLPQKNKQIRFVAGPGETKDLLRKQTMAFDWTVRIPAGLELAMRKDAAPVMVVHVTVPLPTAKPDDEAVKKWIAELDSPKFAVRDAATKKLRELGFAGVSYFQAALKATDSTETRNRLEDLLNRLKGIDQQRLEFPKDVELVGPADQFEQYCKQLGDTDATTRGRAAIGLATSQGDPAEAVKELETFLETEKNEYALRCVASAAQQLGADAKPLVPAMKKKLAWPDANVNQAFVAAVKAVEAAKPSEKPSDEARALAMLRSEIQKTITTARAKAKKP
jgi:hypothetical protein